jgi:hypothetical protein
MSTKRPHPWLSRILTNGLPNGYYVQVRKYFPGNDEFPPDTVINYIGVPELLAMAGVAGGGGSITVHDWNVDTTYAEIQLKPNYIDLGAITELPPALEIQSDMVRLTLDAENNYFDHRQTVGQTNALGDFYFYWKPEPVTGDISYASNSIALYDPLVDDDAMNMEVSESSGIYFYSPTSTENNYYLPGYVPGQVIMVQYSHDNRTIRLTTTTETATVQLGRHLAAEFDLMLNTFAWHNGGPSTGTVSARISSSNNFGSGLLPDTGEYPNTGPLQLYADNPLDAAVKPGDLINITGGGNWGKNIYDQKEVALVVANDVVSGLVPLGVNRTILNNAIQNSTPHYYGVMDVSIGDGGTYPSHYELYEAIGNRAISGEHLTVNLRQSPFANAPDVCLHFPTFENVTIKVDRSIVGTLDLGTTNMEIIGGDTPVHLKNFNVDTLGSLVGEFIQLSQSQINTQGFCLNRWSASSNSSVNVVEAPQWNGAPRSVQKELRNCLPHKLPAGEGGGDQPSSLTVNSSPLDTRDVEVLGSSLDFTLTTTHPVKTGGGVIKSLELNYTGGDGETYFDGAPITASGGSVVYVKSLDYGNANIRFAVAVQDGGIISVNTSNISGTLPPIAYANQLPNVPNDSGLVMMDTAIPANAQIIPLSVYRSSETVVNGNNLASFYVPYPLHLIGVRAALDTAPVGTDSVSVSLTGVGATPDYLIGPILISANQNANGEGMNVVLNPTDVIIEGTRLIVNVPAVDGSTAKGLTVYLIVIPAEISPRPAWEP